MAFLTAMSNSFGARWFDEKWQPQFNTPEWKKTLTTYVDLMKVAGPPGASSNGFNENLALFNAGKIVLMGTVAELGRQVLGGGYAVEVEADGGDGIAGRLAALPGVRSIEQPGAGRFRMTCDSDLRADAAGTVVAAGGRLKQLSPDQPSLETIYTRYFQDAQEARDAA
jgi:hypothetical protein